MAYKRYVHKKGKRHGPYYYKNVRDESGRVRSIYLGKVTSRGKRSLEVAIVFLTVLLIIISALFFIQNRNLVLSKIAAEEAKVPFEVDQILIKVLVKEKEFIEKELRVMNVHEEEQAIRIETKEISHLVDVLDREFAIKPGQTKIVRLNFSSFDAVQKNEQAPGVYIGKITAKTDSYEKEVPVVIEIESRNVLFDMNLNPVARDRTVTQGSSTTFEIRVFNLQSIESFNIDMDFFVKDINGNTIISERESVVVQTQASFFKTLKIPERLKTGNYVFVAQASLGNSVGTASYLFEVEKIAEEKQFSRFLAFCRNDPLCWALSIIVLLLLFAIGAYSYFFIGAFIYKKLFGISVPKMVEIAEKPLVRGKKGIPVINSILSSFGNVAKRMQRAKEERAKRKLELEKQRLMLKEEKEKAKLELQERKAKLREEKLKERERELELSKKLGEDRKKERKERVFDFFHSLGLAKTELEKKQRLEEKERQRALEQQRKELERKIRLREKGKELEIGKRLKEKRLQEKGARRGDVGKCKRLVDKGYRALDRNNVGKADKIYIKIMDSYIKLPSEMKVDVFKDINSFYKSLLIKKQQLKQKGAAEDARKKKFMEEEERTKVREQEKKIIEKEKKGNLAEEKRKEAKKKVFSFFHNLGLIKTEKEKQETAEKRDEEIKQRELEKKKQREEKEKQKALEEERKKREAEEKKKKDEERKRLEEEKRNQEELKRKEQESKKLEEEKRKQEELEKKKQEEENRKKGEQRRKEEENRKKDEERKQRDLEKKKQQEEREKQKALEEERKLEEKKKREEESIRKQKEKEQKSKKVQGIKDLIEEKELGINNLRGKIAEAYSGSKAIAKEISGIEKDIYGLNNEKKTLYGMYNEGIAGKKELAKEHESRIAEWKEKHEAKLKEKNGIKSEIKQEYENELKELENELSKLSGKERKEEEKWKQLELKAKYKLEEHEREKSVNEEIKSQLEEKKEMEHEHNKKKQLGKGIAGREILDKQKELNDHIREHERGIEKLKEKIGSNEKASERYGNEIEKLAEEKEKAEEKLLEATKEAGGLGYIASIFRPRAKKAEKPKQIGAGEKPLQKKAFEIKAKIAEPKHEITKEEVEKEEAKEEEEKKELQSTLKRLQMTSKQIKHKENIIERLAREKEEKGKKETKAEKKPGIFDKFIKGIKAKAEEKPGQAEKEKEHIEIKRKLANKSRLFRKCHGMMLNANDALMRNDIGSAKKLYLKTRDLYIKLEYHEKKEIYDELTELYNKLKK